MTIIAIEQGRPRIAAMTRDYREIQEIVGGFFTTFFTIKSPAGGGRLLTGYVHDEGMYERLPTDIGVVYREKYSIPLFGNAVIGAVDSSGESQPLLDAEVKAIINQIYYHADGDDILFPIVEDDNFDPNKFHIATVRAIFRLDKLAGQEDN